MRRRQFIELIGAAFAIPASGRALAFSPREYPSFTLKVFGYDAVVFYRQKVGQGGLSTTIGIGGRWSSVTASTAKDLQRAAEDLQRQADKADEIELFYNPESDGTSKVDFLSTIPSTKLFSVLVNIHLQRSPVLGQIGNLQILSAIEKLSDDPDRSHFDENGYRVLDYPVVNYVAQRKLYSHPDGSPLFFFRRIVSVKDDIYTLTGSFLVGAHARVNYSFRTDRVPKEHWVEVDKAALAFVGTVLAPPK